MGNHIEGKVVVIVVSSSGPGVAAARLLSAHGASVVPGARRVGRLQFAMSRPEDVDVNEILFRPTRQDL